MILIVHLDAFLSQNTWKVHEEFSLMIEDLERDIPHPGRRRHQDVWRVQNNPLKNITHSEQQISVANGIFFQNGYSIRSEYRNGMESAYKSTLQRLDFANKPELSTTYINRFVFALYFERKFSLTNFFSHSRWVSEKTKGKINEVIAEPLPASTKAVIASALYFKALWERTFIEGGTKP